MGSGRQRKEAGSRASRAWEGGLASGARVRRERGVRAGDAAERACWAGRACSRGLRRAGPDAGSGVGERAAQGRVWAGLREREGELGGSRLR